MDSRRSRGRRCAPWGRLRRRTDRTRCADTVPSSDKGSAHPSVRRRGTGSSCRRSRGPQRTRRGCGAWPMIGGARPRGTAASLPGRAALGRGPGDVAPPGGRARAARRRPPPTMTVSGESTGSSGASTEASTSTSTTEPAPQTMRFTTLALADDRLCATTSGDGRAVCRDRERCDAGRDPAQWDLGDPASWAPVDLPGRSERAGPCIEPSVDRFDLRREPLDRRVALTGGAPQRKRPSAP